MSHTTTTDHGQTRQWQVRADICYLDGPLRGLLLPYGYAVTYASPEPAYRCAAWLTKVRAEQDFIRAAVTGNRYQVVGIVSVLDSPA